MRQLQLILCLLIAMAICACDRDKGKTDEKSADKTQTPPPAPPFDKITYSTKDGKSSITLLSPDTLDYRAADGSVQRCSYSQVDDTLHVTVSSQEWIFQRSPGTLQKFDGTLYLDPVAAHEDEFASKNRERALAAAEQERVEKEKHVEAIRQESKKSKEVVKRFSLDDAGEGGFDLTVTDVSFQARQKTPAAGQPAMQEPWDIWYGYFDDVVGGKSELNIHVRNGRGIHLKFKDEAQCNAVIAAINAAWNKWRAKYPELLVP